MERDLVCSSEVQLEANVCPIIGREFQYSCLGSYEDPTLRSEETERFTETNASEANAKNSEQGGLAVENMQFEPRENQITI